MILKIAFSILLAKAYDSARLDDPAYIPHYAQRLLGLVDAFDERGHCLTEYAGKNGGGAVYRHVSVAAPYDKLRLLTETPALGAGVRLVPHQRPAPQPPGPLERVCHRRQLTPIDEHTYRRARL